MKIEAILPSWLKGKRGNLRRKSSTEADMLQNHGQCAVALPCSVNYGPLFLIHWKHAWSSGWWPLPLVSILELNGRESNFQMSEVNIFSIWRLTPPLLHLGEFSFIYIYTLSSSIYKSLLIDLYKLRNWLKLVNVMKFFKI